jgi:hypothetical protein
MPGIVIVLSGGLTCMSSWMLSAKAFMPVTEKMSMTLTAIAVIT